MAAKRMRKGRPGGVREARELAALVSALGAKGDLITARGVAKSLGCDIAHAKHLLSLLVDASDDEGMNRLPLMTDDDYDEATLSFSVGPAKPLRLTESETLALVSALGAGGLAVDDPLVAKVLAALATRSLESGTELASTLPQTEAASPTLSPILRTCGDAIAAEKDLAFEYRDARGSKSSRVVSPESVSCADGYWYLDAYDLVRGGNRSFRLDRATGVRPVEHKVAAAAEHTPNGGSPREVEFVLLDHALLESIHWKNSEVEAVDGGWRLRMPYYGGTWLVARLAACGARVQIEDEALRAEVRAYASNLATSRERRATS